MKTILRLATWLLPLLLAAAPAPLLAQAARAELTGQVTGTDDAALPGAQITVRALRSPSPDKSRSRRSSTRSTNSRSKRTARPPSSDGSTAV